MSEKKGEENVGLSHSNGTGDVTQDTSSTQQHDVDPGTQQKGYLATPLMTTATPNGPASSSSTGKSREWILPLFVVNIAFLILFYMFLMVYGGGVVRTLERRFGLRSSQTGLMQSANDVIHVCIVVFIGYFGRIANKPRIICVTVLSSALAGFMMASPHFLLAGDHPSSQNQNGSTAAFEQSNTFCVKHAGNDSSAEDQCNLTTSGSSSSSSMSAHPAYYIFLLAQFICGIGGSGIHTLSLAYIDENAPGTRSSFYIGIIMSMYAFGPMGGMLLAGFTLRLPENLLSPIEGDPSDPSWIGCWWLGYVICGTGILLSAIPLWFFPKSCKQSVDRSTPQDKSVKKTALAKQEIKEFPKRLLHLLRNKAFVVNLFSVVCGAYIVMGVYINLVRYIEIHFLERAFVGSLIAGLVSSLAGAVGGFFGGFLMSRLHLQPRGALKIVIFSEVVFTTGLIVILFLRCPQLQMARGIDPEDNRFSVITACNQHCACPTDRKSYSPVCGSDNLTYFSACMAGCGNFSNGLYSDCNCIGSGGVVLGGGMGMGSGSDGSDAIDGFARPGLCRPPCNLLIPFAATLFLMSLLGSIARVPSTIVNLRIVDDDERSFALSLNSFAINLFGFAPSPLLYGALIDSTCILWQTTCKRTGSCLLFDTDRFRYVTYGLAFMFEIIDLILAIILFMFVRKMVFPTPEEKVKEVELENEKAKDALQVTETSL